MKFLRNVRWNTENIWENFVKIYRKTEFQKKKMFNFHENWKVTVEHTL